MTQRETYDIIIIGTGAGGGTLAYALKDTGKKILLIERGDFLPRGKENWDPDSVFGEERYHTSELWHTKEGRQFRPGTNYFVGGNTKVYGAALLRMRERDFTEVRHEGGISPAWPVSYQDLESYYSKAEELYSVHGKRGEDPTEPPHSQAFPFPPVRHEPRIEEVSRELHAQGLRPFHLPMGLFLDEDTPQKSSCIKCNTCDGFPCLLDAKADAYTACLIHVLDTPQYTLLTNTKATEILTDESGKNVTGVRVERDGNMESYRADIVVVACGAIQSAALLLRSANESHPNGLANSSGQVGRNYMHHHNTAMLAVSPWQKNSTTFQKTIGLNDFYWGDEEYSYPMGHIQLLGKALPGILHADKPFIPRRLLKLLSDRSVDWWLTTEDLPHPENRILLAGDGTIQLNYSRTNWRSHTELVKRLKSSLRKIGFPVLLDQAIPINGVAHQVGTTRFGHDPRTSVLDQYCKAHDLDNLYVVDGSFFPSSSAVNPSLTIIAQTLRTADHLKERLGT